MLQDPFSAGSAPLLVSNLHMWLGYALPSDFMSMVSIRGNYAILVWVRNRSQLYGGNLSDHKRTYRMLRLPLSPHGKEMAIQRKGIPYTDDN
jgi:hypothetical protein